MKKRSLALMAIAVVTGLILLHGSVLAETTYVTMYYGDISLDNTWHWMPGTWDMTCSEVIVEYALDLSGAPNVAYTGNYGQAGYVGLVNQPGFAGACMSGFLVDWVNSGYEFPDYPDEDDIQDLDDKFNMQRFPNPGSYDEQMYDVDCGTSPPTIVGPTSDPWDNYGIWFDRDGVDPSQAQMWGMVNGGTYNTGGVYDVRLVYHYLSAIAGAACATLFPDLSNAVAPDLYGVWTGFDRQLDGSYAEFPYGIHFDTDESKMADMQVFVSGNPGNGTIVVYNLTVTGCLKLEEGMGTGGGWFIPESGTSVEITDGGKATFGFVAKQDDKKGSTGQLEFQYHADELNLKSSSYQWVAVAATQVMFKGVGCLNGIPGYDFRVRAVDGDKIGTGVDRFEIRIWTGGDTYEAPTYRAEGDLEGGQIVVHKK